MHDLVGLKSEISKKSCCCSYYSFNERSTQPSRLANYCKNLAVDVITTAQDQNNRNTASEFQLLLSFCPFTTSITLQLGKPRNMNIAKEIIN